MLTRTQIAPDDVGLTDRLGRTLHDLRISVIDRCNFRCPHCMPEERYPEHHEFFHSSEWLTFAEISRLTRLFVLLGVRKLRITGGEPLLRKNLADLVRELGATDGIEDVALTTNGVLLADQAAALRNAGLQRVTVSLDSLDDDVFRHMSGGRDEKGRVLAGISAARAVGLTPVKLNIVVKRGTNDHTMIDLLHAFRGTGTILRFIEYMDVGNRNHWRRDEVLPSGDLVAQIDAVWPLRPLDRNYPGEVASRYAFADGQGEVGFISSVTEPFCRSCTRARLSTNGRLYTCLFAGQGTDLRGPMRDGANDDELLSIIRGVWLDRSDRYSERREPRTAEEHPIHKVEMYQVGG